MKIDSDSFRILKSNRHITIGFSVLSISVNTVIFMKENIVKDKSYVFALKIIQIFKVLNKEQKEFILSKQLIRSGTAIGALIMESEHAQSKADFVNKLNIALKEANETVYWLRLLIDSGYLGRESADLLIEDCKELIRLLASIVKTMKDNKTHADLDRR